MADIAASDVTYTVQKQRQNASSQKSNKVRLQFGDASLTVPSGGIPLTIGKLGCPTAVESLIVVDKGTSGYVFSFDRANSKLIVQFADYDAIADGALIAYTGAIAAQSLEVEVIGY